MAELPGRAFSQANRETQTADRGKQNWLRPRRLASEIGTDGLTGAEELAKYCFRVALKGSARHAELFLNYSEGKPKQGIELAGPEGENLRFSNLTLEEIDARINELLQKRSGKKVPRCHSTVMKRESCSNFSKNRCSRIGSGVACDCSRPRPGLACGTADVLPEKG